MVGHAVVGETTAEGASRLGLGRARAVRDFLVDEGVVSENIEVLSNGLDAPAVTPSLPGAFQKNRRADIWILEQ